MSVRSVSSSSGIFLSDSQRFSWLRLSRCENIGPSTFRQLIRRFGTAERSLDALPDLIRKARGSKKITIASVESIERELSLLDKFGGRIVCSGEPNYPLALRAADSSPPVISVLGSDDVLVRPSVAMVGSRNGSLSGLKLTTTLAREVGLGGYVIVSGLARGIDSAAHRASLATGTIAVFAGGIDHVYPTENEDLAREIVDSGGCLISELPFGTKPRPQDFPRRNRIVAGLSLAVVIIEAAKSSGSLISARLAGELSRHVLAVPGSPLDSRSAGANNLIREGATLVRDSADILEALTPISEDSVQESYSLEEFSAVVDSSADSEPTTEDHYDLVLSTLDYSPTSIDELIRHTGLSTSQIHEILIGLQLGGRVERLPGNKVSLLQTK